MIRRFISLALWTYFAWYLGAMLATFTGGPAVAGPIAALLTALLAAGGWIRKARNITSQPRLGAEPSR